MKPGIAYTRVSTDEQHKEGVSLSAQKSKIERYAAFKGLPGFDLIEEPQPVSATRPLHKRSGGSDLLERIDKGFVTDILVTKLDRMFRDLKDCVTTLSDFEERDIVLHLIDEGGVVDTSTPDGWLQVMIKALFAEYEARQIRFRTRAALQHKKENGEAYGHAPYGWDVVDGRLEPNEDEQLVIRLIKGWREKETLQGIADILNETEVKTKGYGKVPPGKWYAQTVKNVLDYEPGKGVAQRDGADG